MGFALRKRRACLVPLRYVLNAHQLRVASLMRGHTHLMRSPDAVRCTHTPGDPTLSPAECRSRMVMLKQLRAAVPVAPNSGFVHREDPE
jgi:hypothetical protein